MYQSPTRETAHQVYERFLTLYQDRYPKVCEYLTKDYEDLFTFYDFPTQHWGQLTPVSPPVPPQHRIRQTKLHPFWGFLITAR